MIDRDEIGAKSRALGVHVANVQRDYVFGWLLRGIYSDSILGRSLVLKGGNALRKAYFPNGRFSSDLDFSTAGGIAPQTLEHELNRVCETVEAGAGVTFDKSKTTAKEKRGADSELQIIGAKLYFRDFHGHESSMLISVRMDVTEWQKFHLPVQSRPLLHDYSDSARCQAVLRCVKLEEMLASKMKCLLQRRHVADLFDLVYATIIHPDIQLNRREIINAFLAKTIFGNSPASARELLLQLPMAVIKGLWTKFIVCPVRNAFGCDQAEVSLKQLIESVFQGVMPGTWGSRFFPSRFRNPIMEAGYSQTLLDITYQGFRRSAEPYTLTYKRRKDGVAREYLGVWDRTGGSSGPGFKWMVADQVNSIANTGEKFEPRFPIELTKAGETFGSLAFVATRRASTFHSFNRSQRAQPQFSVTCPMCNKRFRRTSPNTSLNPHLNEWGYACHSRSGFLSF